MENKRGQTVSFNRRSRPNPRISKIKMTPVGDMDLNTQRVTGALAPPTHDGNPPITRKTRFTQGFTGSALSFNLSPAQVAGNDAFEYLGATTPVRFNTVRVHKIEAWLAVGALAGGNLPALSITEVNTSTTFTDSNASGVDFAHVAMRFSLSTRMMVSNVSSTITLATIDVPASEGLVGQLIFDVTFSGS